MPKPKRKKKAYPKPTQQQMQEIADKVGDGTTGVLITSEQSLASLQNMLDRHRYERSESPFGENDIPRLYLDATIDKDLWPQKNSPSILSVSQKNSLADYIDFYEKLFQQLLDRYTDYLLRTETMHVLSYADVVQKPVQADTTLSYDLSDVWAYQMLDHSISPTNTPITPQYDWQIFIPPVNQLNVRVGRQAYCYIELLRLDMKARTMRLRVSIYVGKRIRWCCRSWAEYELRFAPKQPNGKLPMTIKYLNAECYETLMSHPKDAGFTDEEAAFWHDVLGTREIKDPAKIRAELTTSPNGDHNEELSFFVYDAKKDISTLRQIDNINIKSVDKSLGIDAFTRPNSEEQLVRCIKLLCMINEHIDTYRVDAEHAAKTAGTVAMDNRVKITFPEPTAIRGIISP